MSDLLDELLGGDVVEEKTAKKASMPSEYVWEHEAICGENIGKDVELPFGRLFVYGVKAKTADKSDKTGVTLNLEIMPKIVGVDENVNWKPKYSVSQQGFKKGMYTPDRQKPVPYMSYPEAWDKYFAVINHLGGYTDNKIKWYYVDWDGQDIANILPDKLVNIFTKLQDYIDESKKITFVYTIENGKITKIGITKFKFNGATKHSSPIL